MEPQPPKSLDSYIPASYKRYPFLPSSNIGILVIIICFGFILFLGVPKIFKWFSLRNATAPANPTLLATVLPSDDPTTRNVLGDGIPDWQKILVGIDPKDPLGAMKFKKIKEAIGADTFDASASQVSDTDKVSLTLYDGITKESVLSGNVDTAAIATRTRTEIANYIQAKKKSEKAYTTKDFVTTTNDTSAIKSYYAAIQATNSDIFDKDFATHLQLFLSGKESGDIYISRKVSDMKELLNKLLTIPVPTTALTMHMTAANGIYSVMQALDTYKPLDNDNLQQLGTAAVVQDATLSVTDAITNLSAYFAVTLETDTKNNL